MSSLFKKRDAFSVFLMLEAGNSLFLTIIFSVSMIYQATVVGLNPLQLVLVGTMLETVIFVFEVPTGVIADSYSRRLSVIMGTFLIGFGFMVEGLFPSFGMVLLAQVFWGLGATFTSGATQAWIADEVGEERAGRAFMRGSQIGQFSGLAGIVIGAGLGTINVALPVVLGGAMIVVLGGVLVVIMPENGFTPAPRGASSSSQNMIHTLRQGLRLVRGRSILLTFLGISAVAGLYSEGFDRLWTPHLLDDFDFPAWGSLEPVIWFGIIGIVSRGVFLVISEIIRRTVDMNNQTAVAHALLVITALTVAGIFTFALAGNFWLAVVALWLTGAMRGVTDPLMTNWMNQHLESSVRATVFSMSSQLNAIGQIAGGPAVGYIGTAGSLRAALVTSSLLLSPALALLVRGSRQSVPPQEEADIATPALAVTD